MNKNIIKFFLLTTIILLVSVSLVSANDITNNSADSGVVSVDNNVKSVNKEVNITNYKLSDSSTDYYVSDTSGSDNNTGTSSSPFKTIQTALNKTTSTGVYNIYIKEGTYKGVGNTNLTVNGNHTINLIGDGINKTILDGEVNYAIGGATVWGADDYWNPYNIHNGNWGLNITNGTGIIKIQGLNIQNMASIGGSNIGAYKTANLDNYGNIEVDSVYFHHNLGGVGASIRNNHNATITITNSIFEDNRKSSSSGNYGSGIYNNGTATINNCNFTRNAGRWGVITNDWQLNISNSIIRDGISYDLGSSYKFGAGIATNTGSSDYFNQYERENLKTIVNNCTFINNGQTDIYQGEGYLYVNNSQFINSTGIFIEKTQIHKAEHIINGSNFTNMQPSTLFYSLSTTTGTSFAIYCNGYNTLIENNTIDIKNNGYSIYIYNNNTVRNNTLNNKILIENNYNNVTNNKINNTLPYSIEINGMYNNITDNTLYSSISTGQLSILDNGLANTIENNTPNTGTEINLTNENYDIYFDENGEIKTDTLTNGSIINIESNFNNKNITFDNIKLIIRNNNKNTLYNTTIHAKNNSHLLTYNINIENNNDKEYTILIDSNNIALYNTTIKTNTTTESKTLIINANNTDIRNINITNYVQPSNTNQTIAILLNHTNNTYINNPTINMYNSTTNTGEIIGIYLNQTNNSQILSVEARIESKNITFIKDLESQHNTITFKNPRGSTTGLINYIKLMGENILVVDTYNSHHEYYFVTFDITGDEAYGVKLNQVTNSYVYLSRLMFNTTNITLTSINNSINNTITSTDPASSGADGNYTPLSEHYHGVDLYNSENTTISYLPFFYYISNDKEKDIIMINIQNSKNTQVINNTNIFYKTNGYYSSIDIITSNGSFIQVNNSNNTEITNQKANNIINTSTTTIIITNSNNTNIHDLNLTSIKEAIIIENSTNNTIENNNINTKIPYSIILNNTNNNIIINNYINGNDEFGGDNTIQQTNTTNNNITNNTPVLIHLTDSNYNDYFINQTLKEEIMEIILDSNIYNKNMTFYNPVIIKTLNNYTIYNTTINSNSTLTLNNIKINNSNQNYTIKTNETLILNNTSIYQNSTNPIQMIKSDNNNSNITIINSIITIISQESNNTILSAIYTNGILNINNTNITIKSAADNGKIVGIHTNNRIKMTNSNINISGTDNITAINSNEQTTIENSTIIITSKNLATGFHTTYNRITINNNFISLTGDKTTIIDFKEDVPYIDTFMFASFGVYLTNNNITLNGSNLIKLTINNTDKIIHLTNNTIKANTFQMIFMNVNNALSITENNITANQNNTPLIKIINYESYTAYGNTTIQSHNGYIRNNYFETNDLFGSYAISLTNATNMTINNNQPDKIILTDDTYLDLFPNGTFQKEYTSTIELQSDIHNKNLTFNITGHITVLNPNNYTLYNSSVIKIGGGNVYALNFTNLNINNTDDRETSIYAEGRIIIPNAIIYQENYNNSGHIIILKNSTTTSSNARVNIAGIGNTTLLTIENGTYSFPSINLYAKGDNVTAIHIVNKTSTHASIFTGGRIVVESDNPTTAILVENSRGITFMTNTILVKAYNNGTPIININNGIASISVNNNYIESYDSYGVNAIVKTGTATINANNKPSETFNTTIKTDTPSTIHINETITINITTTDLLDRPINNGTLTITYNNQTTTINITNSTATYTFTPNNTGINTINFTFTPTNTTYNTTNKIENITINKYNTTINTTNITGKITEEITLNITLTDETSNKITEGNIIIKDTNETILYNTTITNETIHPTITFNTTTNTTLTITYTGTDIHEENTINITINITKYNTIINITNITGKINKTTIISPQVIDELLNNVTEGNITVSDENGTILANSTVTNGTNKFNIKFNTTGNKTLIITYGGTDEYEENTINITATITKLNTTVTVDNVVGVVGENIILVAHIVDEQGDNVTSGRVLFKINGVTLKDTNGSVIYVNVTNGVARLTLTAVRGWTNTGAYISANYAGNSVYLTSVSKNSTVNIAKRNATVEIVSDSRIYKAGETITVTAIVVDSNGELANSGQVVFKLNGVTLKDRNGKTILVNVVNGIATLTYTLPITFADYNYTITAIFAGGDYNRQVSKNSTLQVVKTSIHMDLDPVITTTNTAVIRAKIYDGNNKQITGTTRVTIKLNGVTIINSQNITNGNLQFTINTPYPTGLYNMTIIAGPSSVYEQLQRNTTLVIMKN